MALCDGEIPRDQLRVLRFVVGGFIAGVVLFGVVALVSPYFRKDEPLNDDMGRVLLVTLGGLGILELIAYPLARVFMKRATGRMLEVAQPEAKAGVLYGSTQGLTLLGAAMAEGFGLYGCTIYFIAREPIALLAPVIAVAILALSFPDERRLRRRMCYLEGVEPRMVLD